MTCNNQVNQKQQEGRYISFESCINELKAFYKDRSLIYLIGGIFMALLLLLFTIGPKKSTDSLIIAASIGSAVIGVIGFIRAKRLLNPHILRESFYVVTAHCTKKAEVEETDSDVSTYYLYFNDPYDKKFKLYYGYNGPLSKFLAPYAVYEKAAEGAKFYLLVDKKGKIITALPSAYYLLKTEDFIEAEDGKFIPKKINAPEV